MEPMLQRREGYDGRASLLSLSSVRYYTMPLSLKNSNSAVVPYGFKQLGIYDTQQKITNKTKQKYKEKLGVDKLSEEQIASAKELTSKDYIVYENQNVLPLVYTYDSIIGDDTWNSMTTVEKQEAMLQSVYIKGYKGEEEKLVLNSQSIPYEIECDGKSVQQDNNSFIVKKDNATALIRFETPENSESYFTVKGLHAYSMIDYDFYFGSDKYKVDEALTDISWQNLPKTERAQILRNKFYQNENTEFRISLKSSSGLSRVFKYLGEKNKYYCGVHDYCLNLGYNEEPLKTVTIVFPSKGVYSFDSIGIVSLTMENYEKQIKALKEDKIESLKISNDTVSFNVNLKKEKTICLSIPWADGWTAFADGEEAEIYQANVKNMALFLKQGEHKIKLVYHTPLLKIGLAGSFAGFMLFAAIVIFNAKKKRKKKQL